MFAVSISAVTTVSLPSASGAMACAMSARPRPAAGSVREGFDEV